jgi:hypothetical protein
MPALPSTRFLRTTLMAAGVGLAGAHAPACATPTLRIVVVTCPQAAAGRDPSSANVEPSHNCGVHTPDDLGTTPSWRRLDLLALDSGTSGGNVTATLNCMNRRTGAVTPVATVASVHAPDAPKTVTALLPQALNFARCAYFVHVDVQPNATAKGLMVSLRN